jgi:hypothetical protein
MASLFDRLNKEQPSPPPTKKPQPPLAQTLLDWLQHWSKPTISARDIYRGHNRIRDRKKAIIAAEILAVHGWLIPLKTHRYDRHEWRIVRKPIVYPTVAAETVEKDP